MKFELPKLDYDMDALEPYISRNNLEYHYKNVFHDNINSLNKLLNDNKFKDIDLETIIKIAEGPIFNYAALVWNHYFYFKGLSPEKNHLPKGSFVEAIQRNFGSLKNLKDIFMRSAISLLGSGWVWLVWNPRGSMEVLHESNAGNPIRKGLIPLLTCDLWEHAYYLDYRNRRAEYVESFWKLINWEQVEKLYNEARGIESQNNLASETDKYYY
jgi:superoxide dismutase, Fe-Mn family